MKDNITTNRNPGNFNRFTRLALCVMLLAVMIHFAAGRSDPINQTLSEFNNLTMADDALEVTQEMNAWVGGLFGIFMLIIIFAVTFGITMFYTQAVGKSLALGFFIELMAAIMLRLVSLVPDTALYFSFPLFILSIAMAVIMK